MKIMIKKLLMLSLLGLSSIGFADVKADLLSRLQSMKTLQGNFQQTVKDPKGETIQFSKGKVYIHNPAQFRWETTTPFKQSIVADGKKLWLYDIDLDQVTVRSQQKALMNTPAQLLSGKLPKVLDDYEVSYHKDASVGEKFRLASKRKQEDQFFKIDLTYQEGALTNIVLIDNLGNTNAFTFSKIVVNQRIPDKTFSFSLPKGVDLINDAS